MNTQWNRAKTFVSPASFIMMVVTILGLSIGSPVHGEVTVDPWIHAGGKPLPVEALTPSDVLARVTWVQRELEFLRVEMGKPKAGVAHVTVTQAVPREVYFQALTLLEKIDRLVFEQTGELGNELAMIAPDEVRPGHVWMTVDKALQRVLHVKDALSVTKSARETPAQLVATPTDVFQAIVETNHQLNILLDRQYASQDVYRQVTYAMHYSATLLAHFPKAKRIPKARPLEHGKTSSDVYARLVECFGRVRTIASQSGLSVLELKRTPSDIGLIRPSDVYDIASLIVSDLAYVHSQLPEARTPNQAYSPGRKFPSHVYQRAGMLLDQLLQLEQSVHASPQWLQG